MIRTKEYTAKRVIDLDGPDGNAFVLLGMARGLGSQLGYPEEVQKEISEKMRSGDYTTLVKTFDEYFGDFVILETTNKELLK